MRYQEYFVFAIVICKSVFDKQLQNIDKQSVLLPWWIPGMTVLRLRQRAALEQTHPPDKQDTPTRHRTHPPDTLFISSEDIEFIPPGLGLVTPQHNGSFVLFVSRFML